MCIMTYSQIIVFNAEYQQSHGILMEYNSFLLECFTILFQLITQVKIFIDLTLQIVLRIS